MNTISICIITHNEEENIESCLESAKWADEIVVVDGESTDNTVKICKKYTDKVYIKENVKNLNVNKSYSFKKVKNEWILYLDADERISLELKEEIISTIKDNPTCNGFFVPRKNHFFNFYLRYGGKYPDYQLRLFIKNRGSFKCEHVHERLNIDGNVGRLKNPLLHHPYKTISEYIRKFNFYTDFQGEYLAKKNIKLSPLTNFIYLFHLPILRFFRRYFLKFGFLDGVPGFLACVFDSFTVIVSYAKCWEIQKNEPRLCIKHRKSPKNIEITRLYRSKMQRKKFSVRICMDI